MITQDYRPRTFREVAGQDSVKELLKAIVKNPKDSPKTLIFEGEYGTGKTSCSRILARALNCTNRTKDGDACGECELCKSNIEHTMFYEEFDSAIVGNISDIKELKDTFYFNNIGYKVIVLDESQLISTIGQAALLKVFEETTSNIFFVLCTTHIDKILNTIQSRSLKLRFNLVQEQNIRDNLICIADNKNVALTDDILDLIINKCKGHMRDAHMLLDEYILLGDEQFRLIMKSSIELYYKLIIASIQGNLSLIKQIIESLLSFPISILKSDYEQVVLNIIKVGLKANTSDNIYLNAIISYFKDRVFMLIDVLNDNNIYGMFTSDKRFQTAMYYIVKNILNLIK